MVAVLATVAYANHSWGPYHWARTANPFNLELGDNVSSTWDASLASVSADWSLSTVLDTTVTAGSSNRYCKATNGRVEICNNRYGNNGWLGVASIWISGDHITKGTVKLNDTYFNTTKYNTSAWRNLVMCQEIGHTFGLDHQDENFYNAPLGTCMDYSADPALNQHPNQHDYDQLEAIYAHLDTFMTVKSSIFSKWNGKNNEKNHQEESEEWGKAVRHSKDGKHSLYEKDLGKGEKIITFVFWTD